MIGADYFLFFLGLVWVGFATVSDLRKREVPNWLNFSLILFALAFRYFYAVVTDFHYFLYGLAGFFFFFILANIFYYGKVFAGGDAKLLMGLGAILPLFSDYILNFKMMLYFVVLFMIMGSLYGLAYSSVLVLFRLREFRSEFSRQIKKSFVLVVISFVATGLSLFAGWFLVGIAWLLPLIFLLLPFLYVYAKSVEEACMVVGLSPSKVTEGDWLYRPLRVKNKVILPTWEGLSKRQVAFIQENYRGKVLVKQGIPFVPAFFFAYLFFFAKFLFGFF